MQNGGYILFDGTQLPHTDTATTINGIFEKIAQLYNTGKIVFVKWDGLNGTGIFPGGVLKSGVDEYQLLFGTFKYFISEDDSVQFDDFS